jgi:hypothetical protein
MNWDSCIPQDGTFGEYNVASLSCIPPLFKAIFDFAIEFATVIAVFFIIYGGIKILRSGGDAKQLEQARGVITYAIIGLVIVLSSYFILTVISRVVGLECVRFFSFTACSEEISIEETP